MNTPHIRSEIGVLLGPILFWNAGKSSSVHSTPGSRVNGMNGIRFTRDMPFFCLKCWRENHLIAWYCYRALETQLSVLDPAKRSTLKYGKIKMNGPAN